jgi:hypothetical protein
VTPDVPAAPQRGGWPHRTSALHPTRSGGRAVAEEPHGAAPRDSFSSIESHGDCRTDTSFMMIGRSAPAVICEGPRHPIKNAQSNGFWRREPRANRMDGDWNVSQ